MQASGKSETSRFTFALAKSQIWHRFGKNYGAKSEPWFITKPVPKKERNIIKINVSAKGQTTMKYSKGNRFQRFRPMNMRSRKVSKITERQGETSSINPWTFDAISVCGAWIHCCSINVFCFDDDIFPSRSETEKVGKQVSTTDQNVSKIKNEWGHGGPFGGPGMAKEEAWGARGGIPKNVINIPPRWDPEGGAADPVFLNYHFWVA